MFAGSIKSDEIIVSGNAMAVKGKSDLIGCPGMQIISATVPDSYSPSTILTWRNGSFKIAILKRMVLDFNRKPLLARYFGKALGHGPALQRAAPLQSEIEMVALRMMILDNKSGCHTLVRRAHRRFVRLFSFASVDNMASSDRPEKVTLLFTHNKDWTGCVTDDLLGGAAETKIREVAPCVS